MVNQEIIDRMGDIRRREEFKRLLVFADAPDFHGNGEQGRAAEAMAAQGVTVLYLTMNRGTDTVEVTERVKDHLYLMNQELVGFLD